jgi:hypothetical protein
MRPGRGECQQTQTADLQSSRAPYRVVASSSALRSKSTTQDHILVALARAKVDGIPKRAIRLLKPNHIHGLFGPGSRAHPDGAERRVPSANVPWSGTASSRGPDAVQPRAIYPPSMRWGNCVRAGTGIGSVVRVGPGPDVPGSEDSHTVGISNDVHKIDKRVQSSSTLIASEREFQAACVCVNPRVI